MLSASLFQANFGSSDSSPSVTTTPDISIDNNYDRTSFLDLPAELRNRIYQDVLVEDEDVEIQRFAPHVIKPALLRTQKQIREEALPVFWAANTFAVRFVVPYQHMKGIKPSGVRIAQSFLKNLGTEKAVLLRSFRPVNAPNVINMWKHAFLQGNKREHPYASSCELETYKAQCQEIVKDLLSIGGALGIREEAILLPISSVGVRNGLSTRHWVANHEFKNFVQEGSGYDSIFKRLGTD